MYLSRVDLLQTDLSNNRINREPRHAEARVLIEEPGRPPRIVSLPADVEHRVGRSPDVEISLHDPRVSRVHAALRFDGRQVTVRDAGSSNGTLLAGAAVREPRRVEVGAAIVVGDTRLSLLAEVRPSRAAPGAAVATGDEIVAVDPVTAGLFAQVARLAGSDLPVLVLGETGTGKEVVARELHRLGARSEKPFYVAHLSSLSDDAAARELFGVDGDTPGRHVGLVERAHQSTLLLDEVGDLSPANQKRLFALLDTHTHVRAGHTTPTPLDVRLVATSSRDLHAEVAEGRFREDLYYRLTAVTLAVPPLRSRARDILPLVEQVLAFHGGRCRLDERTARTLQSYRWPGNVRELLHAIEAALTVADGDTVRFEHLPTSVRGPTAGDKNDPSAPLRDRIEELERRSILTALEATGWNQSRAARELGLSRRGLIYKMERFGLKPRPRKQNRGT